MTYLEIGDGSSGSISQSARGSRLDEIAVDSSRHLVVVPVSLVA